MISTTSYAGQHVELSLHNPGRGGARGPILAANKGKARVREILRSAPDGAKRETLQADQQRQSRGD